MHNRSLMLRCDLASALLYASLPLAASLGILTMTQILAVAVLAGAANVVFTTAYQVFLPALIQPAELLEGNAKLQASLSASAIGGPGLAGVTAGAIGAAVALTANAASFLVSAACLLAIRAAPARQPLQAATAPGLRRQVAEGVRYVSGDTSLRLLTVWATAGNLCLSGYSALAVVFLVRVVGLSPTVVGILLAASGLGGVLGALTARQISRRYGTAGALRLTAFAGMPFALLIPLTGSGWRILFFPAGAFITFGAVAAGAVVLSSFRQTICPPHLLGRVVATMRFLLYGVYPLGALLGGLLATCLGIRTALWIALSTAVASGVLLLSPAVRSRRDLSGPHSS